MNERKKLLYPISNDRAMPMCRRSIQSVEQAGRVSYTTPIPRLNITSR
jgi:hypothetical protein